MVKTVEKEEKHALDTVLERYSKGTHDTGSSCVQIVKLTKKIQSLTGHLKTHPKDFHSRRGLLAWVSKRRSLLDYLKRRFASIYIALIRDLDLRR